MVNCAYNGTAKLLEDPVALKQLEINCGMIYNGQENERRRDEIITVV